MHRRTCHQLLALRTVTDHHHIVEELGFFLEGDVCRTTFRRCDGHCLVADIRDSDLSTPVNGQGEGAVGPCQCAITLGTHLNDACAHDGFTVSVEHNALYLHSSPRLSDCLCCHDMNRDCRCTKHQHACTNGRKEFLIVVHKKN